MTSLFPTTFVWGTRVSTFGGDFRRTSEGDTLLFLGKPRLRWRRRHAHTYADPFLFVSDGRIWLFVESMRWFEKGKIAAYSSDNLTAWESHGIVLSEPTHLSYPQVFSESGVIWMIPESHESGAVWLYSCRSLPGPWKKECKLIDGALRDATATFHEGNWYIWATDAEHRLRLFLSAGLKGPYREHPSSPLTSDSARARCGGAILRAPDGAMLRPAQDCRASYGHGLGLHRVDELTPLTYAESPYLADALPRSESWNSHGTHHLSTARFLGREVIAVDGLSPDLTINLLPRALWNLVEKLARSLRPKTSRP